MPDKIFGYPVICVDGLNIRQPVFRDIGIEHSPSCGRKYRGCAPDCPKHLREIDLLISGIRIGGDYPFFPVVGEKIPAYSTDFTSCMEMESKIFDLSLAVEYIDCLSRIVLHDAHAFTKNDWHHLFLVAHAVPYQRCLALLESVANAH